MKEYVASPSPDEISLKSSNSFPSIHISAIIIFVLS